MKKVLGVVALCWIATLSESTAWADTSVVDPEADIEGSSVAEEKTFLNRLKDKTYVNYYGMYRGASLKDLGNPAQPAVDGSADPTTPQSVESTLTAAYKLNKNWMAGVLTHFNYYPVGKPIGSGPDMQMLDPSLIVLAPSLIDRGGFKLGARMMAQLPLSEADDLQFRGVALAITPMFLMSYTVPKTQLTLGLVGYFKQYIPTASAADDVRTYKAYLAPNLNYQVTKNFAATLWFDWVQAVRNRGTPFLTGAQNYYMDIEPGFNWDITNNISFNPILNIYPDNLTLAATSIQASLVARMG